MPHIPVLAEADLVPEGLVAELAGVGLLAVVRPAGVDLEAVWRGEHLLALHARVQVAELVQARPLGGHVMEVVQVWRVGQAQMTAIGWHAHTDANAHADGSRRSCCRRRCCRGIVLSGGLERHHQTAQTEEIFLRIRMVAAETHLIEAS